VHAHHLVLRVVRRALLDRSESARPRLLLVLDERAAPSWRTSRLVDVLPDERHALGTGELIELVPLQLLDELRAVGLAIRVGDDARAEWSMRESRCWRTAVGG